MGSPMLIEAAVETLADACAAVEEGAGRLEVCGDLARGGITPGTGLLASIRRVVDVPLMVMVRPRPGEFRFGPGECEGMLEDIRQAKRLGADGLVIGALLADGTIDRDWTRRMVETAHPLPTTFHRAFDCTPDLAASLEALIASGVRRVLSSGGAATAAEGVPRLEALAARAGGRIGILPGGGIRSTNAPAIARATGTGELHVGYPMGTAPGRVRAVLAALISG